MGHPPAPSFAVATNEGAGMDRRGFIKGLLAAPAAGALVIRPTDASQVKLFEPKIEEPVWIHRTPTYGPYPGLGAPVFDAEGRVLGYIRNASWTARINELSTLELTLIAGAWDDVYDSLVRRHR